MASGLTPRMALCLKAIRELTVDGVPPSYDQLAFEMGLTAKSGVHRVVHKLVERGFIAFDSGRYRSMRIVDDGPKREDLDRLSTRTLLKVKFEVEGLICERLGLKPNSQRILKATAQIGAQERVSASSASSSGPTHEGAA
jgi:SOS-response transcriptional repressor LexA